MAEEPKSFNIPEKQVLVYFWEDEGQFYWHHRILLVATGNPGKWICATPDYEIQLVDLSEHRIVPLTKDEVFPTDYRGYIYSFDTADCSEARVEVMRRQARFLTEIMSGGPAPPSVRDGVSWRVADTADASFGLEIPASITRGKVGLVAFDPEDEEDPSWVTAEFVPSETAHV